MRLASWNVNSVRARLASIDRFLQNHHIDILCLQEIKALEDVFPSDWFVERGFPHQAIRGQKIHHGVAILSRLPIVEIVHRDWAGGSDARYVAIKLENKIVLHNFYVPAGGDVPDPEQNEKFAYKLAFLEEMADWGRGLKGRHILVGDLNVAPHEDDVWSHKALHNVVSHTPAEIERLLRAMRAHDWLDAGRVTRPLPEKLYTWWSYRSPDWQKANKGRRLDHVWLGAPLAQRLKSCDVMTSARSWEKPSDHAPVICELDTGGL